MKRRENRKWKVFNKVENLKGTHTHTHKSAILAIFSKFVAEIFFHFPARITVVTTVTPHVTSQTTGHFELIFCYIF